MNEEKFDYKASDFQCDEKNRVKSICNEYGVNLSSSRRKQVDLFEQALKLKRKFLD